MKTQKKVTKTVKKKTTNTTKKIKPEYNVNLICECEPIPEIHKDKILIEYPKKDGVKRRPLGTFVSKVKNDGIVYGVSKCNKRDIFEKELGKLIAVGRMELGKVKKLSDVPVALRVKFARFMERSQKYFKKASLIKF